MKRSIRVEKYHLVLRERSFLDCQENNNRPSAYKMKRIPKYRIVVGKKKVKVLAEYFDSRKEAETALKRDWTIEGCYDQIRDSKLAHLDHLSNLYLVLTKEIRKLEDRIALIEVSPDL